MWNLTRDALITIIALLVAAVWVIVTLASVITKDYTPLVTVTPVLILMAKIINDLRDRSGNGAAKDR